MQSFKHFILSLTLLLGSSFVANASSKKKTASKPVMKSKTYKVMPDKSTIMWTGTKVTGSHNGTVKIKSGKLVYDGMDLTGGEFVVDMTSINTTDLKGDTKKKLDGHLKSADFFNTSKFKEAKLVIKDAQFGKGGHYDITADLTIKGITKPVMFKANVLKKGKQLMVDGANIVFDRTLYDIKYNSGNFFQNLGDKMINNDVVLKVTLRAN